MRTVVWILCAVIACVSPAVAVGSMASTTSLQGASHPQRVAELRDKLSMIEPTEGMYAGITEADVSALERLLSEREEWIAGRAVFALSRVGSGSAVAALTAAARDKRTQVRIAVAVSVGQRPIALPDDAIINLLRDEDVDVRRFATHAVKAVNGQRPRAVLQGLAVNDPSRVVRENAAEVLRNKFQ
jgi:HEAT repeat protein